MRCIFCSNKIEKAHSFGPQIVCTHFVAADESPDDKFHQDLSIGFCDNCGLIQQTNLFPTEQLVPPYEWLQCTEPEAHLDQLVLDFSKKYNFTKESKIIGVSWKDDTTLERIEEQIGCQTYRLSPDKDLGILNPLTDIESVQDQLTKTNINKLEEHREKYDFLFARHILEHAHNLREFIEASLLLVKDNGHLMFEIPDCLRALESLDYTAIWEEHTLYFTPSTFQHIFQEMGLELTHYQCAEYTLENSLIVVLKRTNTNCYKPDLKEYIHSQESLYNSYISGFHTTKNNLHALLGAERSKAKKVTLFGAAHMSIIFINLMKAEGLIDYVIDDNANKLQYRMPGSGLKIVKSTTLKEDDVDICILSLSPISEDKVLPNHKYFEQRGGTWYSIFPGNPKALPIYRGASNE